MSDLPSFEAVPRPLREAMAARGFETLTPVQQAMLDPALAGRDLRISSQTGSGKTVALGLAIAASLEKRPQGSAGAVRPTALVITPTRELAAQVAGELSWLFARLDARVVAVTGGVSIGGELRILRQGVDVLVGTPGRLVDHLERRSVDVSQLQTVVLDEADEMLDMGFRDELEAILSKVPAERHTHLVSATFSREVLGLASKYQKNAVSVEGTRLGQAHADIEHIAHVISPRQRTDALINLLLIAPEELTLVFVRTRADAAGLADALSQAGFSVKPLTGEMDQPERSRALQAFRTGRVKTLVATDVAARGIDVANVTRVIHADPPNDPEGLTHRSGRTGRAGKKGTSIVLVPRNAREAVSRLYKRARLEPQWKPIPTAKEIQALVDQRLEEEICATEVAEASEGLRLLAQKLLTRLEPERLVMKLLVRERARSNFEAREIEKVSAAPERPARVAPHHKAARASEPREGARRSATYIPFHINWGKKQGADARRLLAVVCRRGGIRGSDVGPIQVNDSDSTFGVAAPVADAFAQASKKPDARDPKLRIERDRSSRRVS